MSRAVMAWVDALPDDQRALVNEFGVWPVHLALGRGLTVEAVRREYEWNWPAPPLDRKP